MVKLINQHERRTARSLAFCYLCGNSFSTNDETNFDHVPPQSAFAKSDRDPLLLPTHVRCNHSHHLVDEKVGQLIALRRRDSSRPPTKLKLAQTNIGPAVWNLDVDATVWRWISGFHSALYREPLMFLSTGLAEKPFARSLVLPFPKGSKVARKIEPLLPQHFRFVETIKINRLLGNVDQIRCNKGQLQYECVWSKADDSSEWLCVFALNVCDWKDLGALTKAHARGCAGHYMIETRDVPVGASRERKSALLFPNYDRADPFAR